VPGDHPAQNRGHRRILSGSLLLKRGRRSFEVEGRRGGQHLVVLLRTPVAPRLEEVLKRDADLTLDAANGLLKHLGETGTRGIDADRVLKFAVGVNDVSFQWRQPLPLSQHACQRSDADM
jgi:hypothetical protein